MKRVVWLSIVAVAAVLVLGMAGWYAITGAPARAAAVVGVLVAVASTLAALSALYLSTAMLSRSDRQLAATLQAMQVGQLPYLAPLHESSERRDSAPALKRPPAELPFSLPDRGEYFRLDKRDFAVLPIANLGVGPAIHVAGALWCSDGRRGDLEGVRVVAPGARALFSVRLETGSAPHPELLTQTVQRMSDPTFFLEVFYEDVFGKRHVLRALFNPAGIGEWLLRE